MAETRALARVGGRLSAAAQRILHVVERTTRLRVAEAALEPQSTAVQKQLEAAAEEIFVILEDLMGEYEAELSKYCDSERSNVPKRVEKMSSHPDKDASAETDPGGQREAVSPSEAWTLQSNKDGTCRILRRSHGADCCKMCGEAAEKKLNTEAIKDATTNKSKGQRCCGKRLDSAESLKAHSEGNRSRERARESSNEDWKEGEAADRDTDEANRASRSQKTESKPASGALNTTENQGGQRLSHLKHCCKVCSKSFCYRASFLRHVHEDESDTDVCGVCGKHHETPESLRLHLQTHVRANDCDVCGKHFDGLKQLEMHMRTHTGEKPYVCSFCGKAFAQNGNLMCHMRAHTGEKPYACSVCGQGFGFKQYLMAHMRIHTGEKPFLCSVCGKGFRQRGTLKTHTRIHTGESTHRCSACGRTFYKRGALRIHMRSHTGEKPYLCNVCGKRYTAGGSLSKHMGVHDGK